jgi:hypothetical protein
MTRKAQKANSGARKGLQAGEASSPTLTLAIEISAGRLDRVFGMGEGREAIVRIKALDVFKTGGTGSRRLRSRYLLTEAGE